MISSRVDCMKCSARLRAPLRLHGDQHRAARLRRQRRLAGSVRASCSQATAGDAAEAGAHTGGVAAPDAEGGGAAARLGMSFITVESAEAHRNSLLEEGSEAYAKARNSTSDGAEAA